MEAAREAGLSMAGIIVEMPSVALRSRHLPAVYDLVSTDTNDLLWCAMAANRMVGEFVDLLDPFQSVVIDPVVAACEGGRINKRSVEVCGESVGDPLMTLVSTGLGVSSLPIPPKRTPLVRFTLGLHELTTCCTMVEVARAYMDAVEAWVSVAGLAYPGLHELLGVQGATSAGPF